MRVALLFDGASATGPTADLMIIDAVELIENSLIEEGNAVVRIPVMMDGKWIDRLKRGKFDVAFNMCEGIDGIAELEPPVIGVLELLGIPYTGGSSYTTSLCLRKHAVNALLGSVGLPVPPWVYMTHGSRIRSPGFPCIVKPAAEDASIGVEQRSVVRSARALRTRVEAMIESFDEVIVQRYVEGRELNVGVLGDLVLPIAEIDFTTLPKGLWPIVTYRSKWDIGSEEDLGAVPKCPAQLPARVANEVRRVALEAWRVVGGHGGYGRIDMRLDHDMRPWILEVNANPDTEPEAGLARMARVAGIDYPALCRRICELAIARKRQVEMTPDMWAQSQELSGMAVPGRNPAPAPELALFSGGNR